MAIEVHGKSIDTDEEGFLINSDEWSQDTAVALADDEKVDMTETHWGLVNFFREYYRENQVHPTMHMLIKDMGSTIGKTFQEEKAYVHFLYTLFPSDPIKQLCKISGLPKPKPDEHDG